MQVKNIDFMKIIHFFQYIHEFCINLNGPVFFSSSRSEKYEKTRTMKKHSSEKVTEISSKYSFRNFGQKCLEKIGDSSNKI